MSSHDRPLAGIRVLSFVDDVYEDLELWYPKYRLIEAGAEFIIAAHEAERKYSGKHGYPCISDVTIEACRSEAFQAVLLPGGFMPDKLRRDPKVKSLIREFSDAGKCVAAICHGGWMAISAGVYRGVQVTGSPGIKDDLENAGAIWVDAPVVIDRHFVSSRKPDDLPDFCRAMIEVIGQSLKLVCFVLGLSLISFAETRADEVSSPPLGTESKEVYDSQPVDQPRLSPEETVKLTVLPDGFQMQVAAKSPEIRQPIGMCWDSRGRLWVVENYTYAEKEMNFDEALNDRILIFEDTDGDGTLDRRNVFWDQGKKLTSIEIGYGGVWALAPPQLLFIPDRNHDDLPDAPPEVVLDGFEHQTIRHNLANGLRWGPDGWLYGRHGIQAISKVGQPGSSALERTVFSCAIWRWHPIRKKLDIVCQGTTNSWGYDWDKHGQLFFINTVIGHLWHAIPGAHVQRMHGDDLDSDVYELMPQVADHLHFDSGKESWSDIRNLGVSPTTDMLGGGHAHTGMMIYQGNQWPAAYRDKLLTLNFHGRRINVERLERHGAGFVGRHEPDMVRFSDPWFRGIELSAGPDGSVFVLDWSDIGECHENDGVHRNSGTIYRIAYGPAKAAEPIADVRTLTEAELLAGIHSSNAWFARQARLMIAERFLANEFSPESVAMLGDMLTGEDDDLKRLSALWTLAACGLDTPEVLRGLLTDDSEHLRLHAVHLLVDPSRGDGDCTAEFAELARNETSDLVKLHLAGAMQKCQGKEWWAVMETLCRQLHLANDRDYPLMLWYAFKSRLGAESREGVKLLSMIDAIAGDESATSEEQPASPRTSFRKLTQFASRFLASRMHLDSQGISQLLATSADGSSEMQADVLLGMQAGLQGRHKATAPDGWDRLVKSASHHPDLQVREGLLGLQTLFGDGVAAEQLAKIVRDKNASAHARRSALESMTDSRVEGVKELAYSVLRDQHVSGQAMATILKMGTVDDAEQIMAIYPDARVFRPGVLDILLNGLAGRREYFPVIFRAVEEGRIDPGLVDAAWLRQMQMLDDPEITEKLATLWPQTRLLGRERMSQIRTLESQLSPDQLASARLGKGRAIWDKLCAACHKLYGQGGLIGPELTGAQRTNLRYLTENIVDPSATVAANYRISLFQMDDGTLISGVVLSENEVSVTLQTVKERIVFDKAGIAERKASTQSLMPEGLLDALDESARRDLIGYLMSPRPVEPE